jgi:hypothetical protein
MQQTWIWVLVPVMRRIALSVVREPVLVAIDAHQVLETNGNSGLLVCFQLGKTDDRIGVHHRTTQQVLMPTIGVMIVYNASVIVRSVVVPATSMGSEF